MTRTKNDSMRLKTLSALAILVFSYLKEKKRWLFVLYVIKTLQMPKFSVRWKFLISVFVSVFLLSHIIEQRQRVMLTTIIIVRG